MQIVKRKIGNGFFYYLKHNIRKGTTIITSQKYLGKSIPNQQELEKIKIELASEQLNELHEKLESIKRNFQNEWKRIPESAKEKELNEIAIAFTYNTNAIEGSTITLEETREIVEDKIAPNKLLRDVKETEEHAKLVLNMLKKKQRITKELILEWHNKIFGSTKGDIAGRFRDYLVRVGSHLAPDWQDVEKLMHELINYINKQNEQNPAEFAAIVHYKFEKIHPFGDGNGRIGRLLMNHMLWHDRYPMLIIDYKKRKSYYRALSKDENYFVKYFIRRYLTSHKRRID